MIKNRMQSFVVRGNRLIQEGKKDQALKLISQGLQYYSNKIIKAISPYAQADAGLLVMVLRHLANEVETKNPGAKEMADYLEKHTTKPSMTETVKVQKPNLR